MAVERSSKSEPRKVGAEGKKPRRWRRRFLWMLVILLVFGWWLNGPGFRWLGPKLLSKVGMESLVHLSGSLLSGFELRDFVWKDAASETSVQGALASVRYQPWRILRGGPAAVLQSVTLTDATVVLDNRVPKPPKEKKPGPPRFPISRLPQPHLALENVRINVLLPEDKQIDCDALTLNLSQGEQGALSIEQLALPKVETLNELEGILSYTERGIALTALDVRDGFAIDEARFEVNEDRAMKASAAVGIQEATLSAAVTLGESASARLSEEGFVLEKLPYPLGVEGDVKAFELEVPAMQGPWREWGIDSEIVVTDLRRMDVKIDAITLELKQSASGVNLDANVSLDSENAVALKANAPSLNEDEPMNQVPWELELAPNAPVLSKWMEASALPVTVGALSGSLTASGRGAVLGKTAGRLNAGQVSQGDWQIPATQWILQTENEEHVLRLKDEGKAIVGECFVDQKLEAYRGQFAVEQPVLTKWQAINEEAKQISGAVEALWSGQGNRVTKVHEGSLELKGRNVGPAVSQLLYQADVKASYEGSAVRLESLQWQGAGLVFAANGAIDERGLNLERMELRRDEDVWMSGDLLVPKDVEAPCRLRIDSVPVPVGRIAALLGKEVPLVGTIEVDADITGPRNALEGKLSVQGLGLGQPDAEGLPRVADLLLDAALQPGEVKLTGKLEHELLQPITLDARLPLDLAEPAKAMTAPLEAQVTIPSSDLGVLDDFVEALEEIDGEIEGNLRVTGTPSQPQFGGALALRAKTLRFLQEGLPELEDTVIRVKGGLAALEIEEGRTSFAGGKITLGGGVEWNPEGPLLDLQLGAQQALLTRNENMVARANAAIRVAGPVAQAAVTGSIGIVESRYFQEIEIIPTNRPATSLPASPMTVEKAYGTTAAPFKDWTIDLQIRTEEPFRVRTNLASADIVADLKLRGKLEAVYPEGYIDMSETFAQLPFSRLDLDNSFVRFSQASGFPGVLDITGISQIRDYRIRILVTGNANKFDYVLTSNPPLPEEEIMALLGTGATREDLVGSGQAAASRAAVLLFDKLWRKIAKKDWEDPKSMREKRLTFESGQVNARTGSPMSTARLRLTDRWSITGDADIKGDFRGLLHWMIKF